MPTDAPSNQNEREHEQEDWDRSISLLEEHRQRAPMLVATAPLIITAVVGLVYIGGAITKIGQIRDAGYEPRDIFASIPIEQHLGRGLVLILAPTLLFVFLWYAGSLFSVPAAPKNQEQLEQLERERKQGLKVIAPISLVTLALISFFGPLSTLAQLAVGLVAAGSIYTVVFWYPPILRRTRRAVVWTVMPAFTITFFAAGAFIAPSPLPEAWLEPEAGLTIRGPLLLQANGEWWVGQPHGRIRVVQAEDVRTLRIRSRDRKSEGSLKEKIFG